jgi:hypothetical protein
MATIVPFYRNITEANVAYLFKVSYHKSLNGVKVIGVYMAFAKQVKLPVMFLSQILGY